MDADRLPRILVVAALLGSTVGLTACGSETTTDVRPRAVPNLVPPTGGDSRQDAGAGDQAGSITDLPTTTTGPVVPTPDGTADGTASDDGSASSGEDTGGATPSTDGGGGDDTGTGSSGGATAGGGSSTGGSGSTGSTGTGTGTTGGGNTGTGSGSDSSGGAAPSEFNEFCQTNPGVCR